MARYHLIHTGSGLALEDRTDPRQQPLKIDFRNNKLAHRRVRGGKKELLLRAVGAKSGLRVSDWTAGLGTDSFLMAGAGCHVSLFERSTILSTLLKDALRREFDDDDDLSEIVNRMTLYQGDARDLPHVVSDVIYLDPMFPSRKKTALVNGPMQYLQRFIGPDRDAQLLIDAACAQPVKRVVVKRPNTAPEANATFTLRAKANRFDVYERPEQGCS